MKILNEKYPSGTHVLSDPNIHQLSYMFSFTTHLVLMGPFIKNMTDAVQNNKTLDTISITVTTFNTAYVHQQYTSPITLFLQT